MSLLGLKKAARVLSIMQLTRIELLGGDVQDILLGQLLGAGHEHMKNRFTRITLLKLGKRKKRP
jgi:hypothetical protein